MPEEEGFDWVPEESKREYNGKMSDAAFVHHEAFGDTLLLSVDVVTDRGFTRNLLLTCGPDWETPDGGKTAVHPAGLKIVKSATNLGKLITNLGKIPNMPRIEGDPMVAASWNNLPELWWEEDRYLTKDKNGNEIEKGRDVPKALAGAGGVAVDPSAPFTPTAAQIADMKKVAGSAADHELFVDGCYTNVTGFEGALETWALNADNYETLLG